MSQDHKLQGIPNIDFRLEDVPDGRRADVAVPLVVEERPEGERFRIRSLSLPCDQRGDIHRLLNDHLNIDGRRKLDSALKQCRVGDKLDMDFYDDGSFEAGMSGIGKLRLKGRF